MKKLYILISICLFATASHAGVLRSYLDVTYAVINGRPIHFVIDFPKCASENHDVPKKFRLFMASPNMVAVLEDHVAASASHFTLANPDFIERPVYEYGKFTVTPENTVKLVYQVLDALTYVPLAPAKTFECQMGLGAKIYG